MQKTLKTLNQLIFIAWPFLVFFSLWAKEIKTLFVFGVFFFSLRLYLTFKEKNSFTPTNRVISVVGLVLSIGCLYANKVLPMLYYPVLINMVLLVYFASSLLGEQTIIERIARFATKEKNFPPEAVLYTRKVTIAWCFFFVLNGSIALATAFLGDAVLWIAWNGCASYILIGAMLGGEYIIRRHLCPN